MPEEGELVLCTITKIFHHSVFANLDEFGKQGMIYISEVAPGRIRNLRDYVVEGKKVVCKILKIDIYKGHIDLSLRRVNDSQKRKKLEVIKQEQKAEKIIENLASELKLDVKNVYFDIFNKINRKYEFLHIFFLDFVSGEIKFEDFEIDQRYITKLTEFVKQRIKLPIVNISGNLILQSYEPQGAEIIKKAIKLGLDKKNKDTIIKYKGAGKYSLSITARDYNEAETVLYNVTNATINHMIENYSFGKFERKEK